MDLVFIFGLISMLADTVYEGGRSLIPTLLYPHYGLEGLGLLSGVAEGSGYLLRALSGVLADRLGAHWSFMFFGYLMVLSYPLSALFPSLTIFIIAVFLERIGKAIRSPSKAALLSAVSRDPGRDFGIVELMDQVGAIVGPFAAFLLLSLGFTAREALLLYVIPAVALIPLLLMLRGIKPKEKRRALLWTPSRVALFSFLIGLGFAQPILVAGGAEAKGISAPLAYTVAMLVDALVAVPLGKLYSSKKRIALLLPPVLAPASLSLYFPQLIPYAGVAIAYEEVVLKAMISEAGGTGTLYGLAFASLGLGSLIGGVLMPLLSPIALFLFSTLTSLGAVIFSAPKEVVDGR